jgi:hypothetical protein
MIFNSKFDKLINSQHINHKKKSWVTDFELRTYLVEANKSSSKLVKIQSQSHKKEKQTEDTKKKHQLPYFNNIPKLERKKKKNQRPYL